MHRTANFLRTFLFRISSCCPGICRSRRRLILIAVLSMVGLYVYLFTRQAFRGRGFGYAVTQCMYKSYGSIDSYQKTGGKFLTISDVLESASDWEKGFFSSTFPTDKAVGHNYTRYYDDLFVPYLALPSVNVLEVGIKKGGFVKALRELFSRDSYVYGIDIDPAVPQFPLDAHIKVILSDSGDCHVIQTAFRGIQFDIILDDGKHTNYGVQKTFQCLHRSLKETGVYVIEDSYGFEFEWFARSKIKSFSAHPDIHPIEKMIVLYPEESLAKGILDVS